MSTLSRCTSCLFTQPLDLVKNRMQVTKTMTGPKPSSASVILGVIRNDGVLGMYNGLSAGLFRQATYTTARWVIATMVLSIF